MVTCDAAGASHELVKELDRLACRHGYQVTWSVGWALGAREQQAIGKVPETAWEAAIDAKGQVGWPEGIAPPGHPTLEGI